VQQLSSSNTELAAEREQLTADKDRMVPQLEQARWQARQLERKLEEAAAAKDTAEQVCGRGVGVCVAGSTA
jgi:outer membrane murein-binding lipoprotein Lpp